MELLCVFVLVLHKSTHSKNRWFSCTFRNSMLFCGHKKMVYAKSETKNAQGTLSWFPCVITIFQFGQYHSCTFWIENTLANWRHTHTKKIFDIFVGFSNHFYDTLESISMLFGWFLLCSILEIRMFLRFGRERWRRSCHFHHNTTHVHIHKCRAEWMFGICAIRWENHKNSCNYICAELSNCFLPTTWP